jgi:bifunctional non-homologous end joining protein LigD
MGLREYERKRDFSRTAEPKGGRKKRNSKALRYVIQKHNASRLHYDFRLEMEGVLKSWAVPKGVPFEQGEKHLAVFVEDHPLDYAAFEGTIPKGQYGGGTVMVWDTGTYESLGGDPLEDLKSGKLHIELHGKKLRGEWTLIRIRRGESGNEWLLLKSGESMQPLSKKADDSSALTGRTMARIASENDAQWESNRSEPSRRKSGTEPRTRAGAKAEFVEPMKAKLVDSPPHGSGWIYELKFDGFRALAVKEGRSLTLLSRNEKPLTAKFPELLPALTALPWKSGIIDGEIVALDPHGRSSFQLLQAHDMGDERPPICYYAFDLLNLDGADLRGLPLVERKAALEKLLAGADDEVRYSASIEGDAAKLIAEVRNRGLEGIIGKKRDSSYEAGRRSGAWVKLKVTNEQEFVIGGYTAPQGSRKYFGALLVGVYENEKLQFTAKVGTGYSDKLLRELHRKFQPLVIESCPFVNLPTQRSGRWGQGITRAEMKRCTWLRPQLVAQVRFTEWTRDAGLRHPAFLGLREDKAAREVVRERAA